MKWVLVVLGILVLAFVGMRLYYAMNVNPKVAQELRDDPNGERAALVMLLTFPDGREIPVNYLREGDQVFAGADGRWWRAFREGDVPVTVFIKGEELTGRARTVLDDPEYTRDVFTRLRPNVPKWLPEWLDAYLVVIDLESRTQVTPEQIHYQCGWSPFTGFAFDSEVYMTMLNGSIVYRDGAVVGGPQGRELEFRLTS